MTELSENDELLELIQDHSRWSSDFPADLAYLLRHQWVTDWVNSISSGHPWAKVAKSAAIPIGLEAIHQHGLFAVLTFTDPEAAEQVEAAAVLPGDEHLYCAVRAQFGGSYITALFLARPVSISFDGPRKTTVWNAGDIAFQIAGYPADRDVQRFMKDASVWWRTYSGKRLPAGGRPRKELDYAYAKSHYERMTDMDMYEDRPPTDKEFLDFLRGEAGVSMSQDTFTKIKRGWRAAGQIWPPTNAF